MSMSFAISLSDVLILGIVALFMFYGAKRGVRGTLNSILRIYFSFIIALLFYEKLALLLQAMVDMSSGAARIVCFTILFAILLSAMWTTGVIIKKRVSKPTGPNSNANRIGGAALGLLEVILLLSIVIMDVNLYPVSGGTKSPLDGAISYRAVRYVAQGMESFTIVPLARLREVSRLSEPDESESENP